MSLINIVQINYKICLIKKNGEFLNKIMNAIVNKCNIKEVETVKNNNMLEEAIY